MNIIEAIKSGKRFKRASWQVWHIRENNFSYSLNDLLADDWEVDDRKIEISESEYYKAKELTKNLEIKLSKAMTCLRQISRECHGRPATMIKKAKECLKEIVQEKINNEKN